MTQSSYSAVSRPLIPLSSGEALWEWDLVSDIVFFSEGARKLLKLTEISYKMRDFLEFVNQEDLPGLIDIRSEIIRGEFRGVAEYEYTCNGQQVHEHILPLSRNSNGHAVRLMARLSTPEDNQSHLPFNPHTGEISRTGVWFLHVPKHKIWQDEICASIMGLPEHGNFPLNSEEGFFKVHFSERTALLRHYDLFIKGELGGDTITDIVHVQHTQGHFIPILIRASAVERDADGVAILITGLMTPANPDHHDSPFSRDDHLFHALNSMGVGQWNWDAKVESVWYCPRYLAILGYPAKECDNFRDRWHLLVHPDDLSKIEKARENIISSPLNGDSFECTYRMKDVKGDWVWIFDRGCVTWRDSSGRAGHMVGSITNITTAQAERDKLEELVRHDSLTGLRSRAFCNLELEHIEQNNIRPVSAISVDITGLKMINDSMGHAVGDELLTKASTILRGALRASDFIARTGGDEFLVLLPNCDLTKGQRLLKKIQSAFDDYNSTNDHMPVIAACGLASANDMSESINSVIVRADQNMYNNKKASRQTDQAILRNWIKTHTGKDVPEDDRVDKEF